MNLSAPSPFTSKVNKLLSWGHWFTFANICLALIISLGYLLADSLPETKLGIVYMLLTWLGHIGFLTFLSFVLTVFPLSLIFPYPRHIRGMAAVLATLGASLMIFDAYVYFHLGYHITSSALPQIISLIWQTIVSSPALATFVAGAIFFSILSFELIISNYTWKHLEQLKQVSWGKPFTGVLIACFIFSHSIHIWADANFEFDITKQDNVLPMSYPTTAKSLLAKNSLLDLKQYKQNEQAQLETSSAAYLAPKTIANCAINTDSNVEIFVFNTQKQLLDFANKNELVSSGLLLQPSDHQDALFNLIYGLPAYYKQSITKNEIPPSWDQQSLLTINGESPFSYITNDNNPNLTINLNNTQQSTNIATRHVIAFSLAEGHKNVMHSSTFYSNDVKLAKFNKIVQPSDLLATVISQYWQCPNLVDTTLIANSIYTKSSDTGINYTQDFFVTYKKDKITLIASDGTHKNISVAQGFVLDKKLDVPFIVESIKQLKRFSTQ